MILKRLGTVFLFLFLFFCSAYAEEAAPSLLTAQEVRGLLTQEPDSILPLDVRTSTEYSGGHLQNAENIDFLAKDFQEKISHLDRNKAFLLYCRTGRRSEAAARMLRKAGFNKVFDLKGGIRAWEEAGFPLEKAGDE